LTRAQSNQVKDALKRHTEDAVQTGAFGAPWFVVENNQPGSSETQVFFGSDRMESIALFLGVKYYGPNPTHLLNSSKL
jgi:glutathione S-transferase kappa 1